MIHELHECMNAWLPWLHAWNAIEAGSDTKCERGMPWHRGCSRECIVMKKPDVLLDDEVVETLANKVVGRARVELGSGSPGRVAIEAKLHTYCERSRSSLGS